MKAQIFTASSLLSALLLFVAAACTGHHEQMRQQLALLQQHNQQDSVLTNDSLAQALADWFDDHGTPNEQVLAHYLLGRTHADRGEAPAAIAAYHDAIDHADTTAADCDYGLLCRVYAQMANVFYNQNLLQEQLSCLEKASQSAFQAKDTMTAMGIRAYEMTGYDKLEMPDSVLSICRKANEFFSSIHHPEIAAQYLGLAIKAHLDKAVIERELSGTRSDSAERVQARTLEKKELEQAKDCIDKYESCSGYFDSNNNIERGREAYYYLKGDYFFFMQQYDSARYYYRKELNEGNDFNNQYLGSKGLAKLFLQTNHPDSAAKYALYSSEINDSISSQTATVAVVNTLGLYNYTRHQQLLSLEREKAEQIRRQNRGLFFSLAMVIAIVSIVIRLNILKRRREREKTEKIKTDYLKARDEVLLLRSQKVAMEQIVAERDSIINKKAAEMEDVEIQKEQLGNQLKEKEAVLELLLKRVEEFRRSEKKKEEGLEERIAKSPVMALLHDKANKGKRLSDDEWNDVSRLVLDLIPELNHFIMQKRYALNDIQYRTCILLRLHIPQASIGVMLGVSPPYIQKMCRQSLKTLFDMDGTGSDLHEKLIEVGL